MKEMYERQWQLKINFDTKQNNEKTTHVFLFIPFD